MNQGVQVSVGKRGIWKKIGVGLLILIVVLVLGVVLAFRYYYGLLDNQTDVEQMQTDVAEEVLEAELDADVDLPEVTGEELAIIEADLQANLEAVEENGLVDSPECFNLLLVGVDTRHNSFSGRSDAMILVSINQESKKIVMTSLLRDIYVSIPGHGSNRLNAAYAYGGTELLTETIQANFGIEVDRCAVVNFFFVMDLIDALGGVELDVTADEIRVMNSYIKGHNKLKGLPKSTDILDQGDAGMMHLNGSQALAYTRVRYVGSDFARTGRQRELIMTCLEQVKGKSILEIHGLLEEFLPRVRTDLTEGECVSLLLLFTEISSYEMVSLSLPVDGTWNNANINGMSVLTVDFAENAEAWKAEVTQE